MLAQFAVILAAAHAATAHFQLKQPQWRVDTLADETSTKYSQWYYPCGGASYGQGNTTDWPLDGGNLELGLHHPWTYVYVNLGLGGNTTNFNITLTPDLWNTTGSGTLCVDKLNVPSGIADGTLASLQVVTAGAGGQALYNCADIRFSKAAKRGNCTNQGVTLVAVKGTASNSTSGTPTSSGGSTNETGSKKSAAVAGVARDGVLTTMAGAAALLAFSMSL